jgi:hypothetical protein
MVDQAATLRGIQTQHCQNVADLLWKGARELDHACKEVSETKTKWIAVKDQLPYPAQDVFACHAKEGWLRVTFYRDYDNTWNGFEPTHWMPLPDLPDHIGDSTEKEVQG